MGGAPAARSNGTENAAAAATSCWPGCSPSHLSSTLPPSDAPSATRRPFGSRAGGGGGAGGDGVVAGLSPDPLGRHVPAERRADGDAAAVRLARGEEARDEVE